MTIEQIVLNEIQAGRLHARAVRESQPMLMLADIKRVIRRLERHGKLKRAGFGKQIVRAV